MKTCNKVIFGGIGLMMALATAAQFFLFVEFGEQCTTADITTAPGTAGACLAGSFVFNIAWVAAKRSGRKTLERASILLWTMLVVVGLAAVGGTLGQAFLAEAVCGQAITTTVPVLAVQYVSIGALLLSIAVPHAMEKKAGTGTALRHRIASRQVEVETGLFVDATSEEISHQTPLVFL